MVVSILILCLHIGSSGADSLHGRASRWDDRLESLPERQKLHRPRQLFIISASVAPAADLCVV